MKSDSVTSVSGPAPWYLDSPTFPKDPAPYLELDDCIESLSQRQYSQDSGYPTFHKKIVIVTQIPSHVSVIENWFRCAKLRPLEFDRV